MKKTILLTVFLYLVLKSTLVANQISLSNEEKEYLKNNTFTYAGDPNWLPFEAFDKQGEYIGIISEHIDIIEKKLDLKFKKIITKDWLDTLELSKKFGVDIISGDAADEVLAKNYRPIEVYIQNPLIIVTRDNHSFVSNLNHIKDEKIAYANGGGYSSDIVKKYPNIKFLKSDTLQAGLLGVKSGKYDVFIGTLAMTDYSIIQMGIEGVKIAGGTGITMNLTLFVDKNRPQLHTIINKTMKSISNIQKHKIISKWRHSKLDKIIVDYTLVWQILLVSIVIILFIFIIYIKQKRLKRTIEIEKNKFKNIFEKSTDGILILTDGVFTDCNDAIVNILQYKNKDKILSLTPSQLSPQFQPDGKSSLEMSKILMKETISKGSNHFEWVHLKSDGSEFWVDIMLTDISVDGKNEIIHVVWRDITEKKKLEQKLSEINKNLEKRVEREIEKNRHQQLLMLQQSRLAQMGEMISMIAHQWRQPLNNLSLMIQLFLHKHNKNKLDESSVKYFTNNSKKQIDLMSETIDDFRDFFKPDKERVDFCINDVVIEIYKMTEPLFVKNKILVKHEADDKIYFYGFANEFGQALINILNNAKDALIENNIVDKIIIVKIEDNDDEILITITDNAGGIPNDIIDKVFDPYFSTKEGKNGTGLGLYMTKLIIQEHLGGKISVANRTDGAEFKITLTKN